MKASILAVGLALGQVYANLPIPNKPMTCIGVATCNRGQPCDADGKCIWKRHAEGDLYPQSFRRSDVAIPKELQARAAYSSDGKCGSQNGGLICDPNSKVYTGYVMPPSTLVFTPFPT
ncbi:MAG: hypothetical protein Q9190_003868 [Brigantiaea leucoxantha]